MKLLESGEMYLETILILSKQMKRVHAVDIAEYMGFSKPSVSRGLARLKADDYILVKEGCNCVFLTEKGKEVAERIYERHLVITEMLLRVGVSPEAAAADACKIEHDLSDETFEQLKKHAKTLKKQ